VRAGQIRVYLLPDGSVAVEDDGRGIPCGTHAKTGRSALETVMTVLHAGGKFGDNGYSVSGGLHGVGVSVVNALSDRCTVRVRRDGFEHCMGFARGVATTELERQPLDAPDGADGAVEALSGSRWREGASGTRVTFLPDRSIFKEAGTFDADTLARRFDQLAYLNAGLTIEMVDQRPPGARKGSAGASAASAGEAEVGGSADADAAADAAEAEAMAEAEAEAEARARGCGKPRWKTPSGQRQIAPVHGRATSRVRLRPGSMSRAVARARPGSMP
jgi:hypothetical protein